MKIQRIITAPYTYPTPDLKKIQEALDEGWTIAFSPTVVPAFAGCPPEIIYVLETELNI